MPLGNPSELKSGVTLTANESLEKSLQNLRQGQRRLRKLPAEKKNSILLQLAKELETQVPAILSANQKDLQNLSPETSSAFRDRLTLNPKRISSMAESLRQVSQQSDPVGELVDSKVLPNGLLLKRIRSPLGVIFMIFESRPNVILEAFSLAFKSGNSIVLRGGSESTATSECIYQLMSQVLKAEGLDFDAFVGLQNYDRSLVESLLKRKDLIDIAVPRGGERLIDFVQRTALMPIIKNDRGMCHTYVDENADLQMAVKIVQNAKTQRPGVCNALETVLVHEKLAESFIRQLYQATDSLGLQWHADSRTEKILQNLPRVQAATKEDWDTEYLDLIINCRVVQSLDEAMEHIEQHGSKHSEAIVTNDERTARRFQEEIDAAAVYWNASTRFTDGFEFGLGGELGISTQKLHVRGPVGLRELTTPRWMIDGSGQIRS